MKTPLLKYIASGLAALALTASCSDMLDTKSTVHGFDEGESLTSPNDSLYSAMGILSQMQKIGERYVLFGELRGDLVTVTSDASYSMQEIAEFNVNADNAYRSRLDFYSIINNCNYALRRIDTEATGKPVEALQREAAAILAMRDWTYLQMGLAFGSVKFITEPILSLEESLASYPDMALDNLVERLIEELEPIAEVITPNYGNIDGFDSRRFFVQPLLLLADLHLYRNNYPRAAELYYRFIARERITVSPNNGNYWASSSRDQVRKGNTNAYTNEACMLIPYSSDASRLHPDLVNLTYSTAPVLRPAQWFVDDMNGATYYQADNLNVNVIAGTGQGDLRGMLVFRKGNEEAGLFGNVAVDKTASLMSITKFYANAEENSSLTSNDNKLFATSAPRLVRQVVTCRVPHVYLRYAEAVNRCGKPTLAFAVLKHGLNRNVMTDSVAIAPAELESGEEWLNFATLGLDNYGTAMRGRGLGIRLPDSGYVIPQFATREETIEWVENEIVREMAAETAFEGNRFFDLLRVSHHRTNHPAYMVEKIAARAADPARLAARLADPSNWWIK